MKILAMYLPQFHEIEENNQWWGKGYTEWNAVKNAVPWFKGHNQPRRPLDDRYYDLEKEGVQTWNWQAELAKKYHIHGFCIYHYWFEGKQLLEKPMEILFAHPEIDVNYCICWANETWRKNWYGQGKKILQEQTYGAEDAWNKHFDYLLQFFRDERYIKIQNKPVINIYHTYEIDCLKEMLECWNKRAVQEGFEGIYVISGMTGSIIDDRSNLFDAYYVFEPGYTLKHGLSKIEHSKYLVETALVRVHNKVSKKKVLEHKIDARMIYRHIEKRKLDENTMPGTFPQWDNTPRSQHSGLCYTHTSPEQFETHMQRLQKLYGDNKEFLYINAWNEWGEGAYLEPDSINKYAYLESVRNSVV